jgi:hypothetical protein
MHPHAHDVHRHTAHVFIVRTYQHANFIWIGGRPTIRKQHNDIGGRRLVAQGKVQGRSSASIGRCLGFGIVLRQGVNDGTVAPTGTSVVNRQPPETVRPLDGISSNTQKDIDDIKRTAVSTGKVQGGESRLAALLGGRSHGFRVVRGQPLAHGLPAELGFHLGIFAFLGSLGAGTENVQ